MTDDIQLDALDIEGGVYLLADALCGLVKVGMSNKNVGRRLTAIQTASPHPLELLAIVRTLDPARLEIELHWGLRELRVRGEWYRWSEDALSCTETVVNAHLVEMGCGFVEVPITPSLPQIMRQGRWKDQRTAITYIRAATVFKDNPTEGLGDDEETKK